MDLRGYKPSEELLRGAPCRVFLRMCLGRARVRDVELRRLATYPDRAEQGGACGVLETGAAAAPPNGSSCALETEANPSLLGSPECELLAAPRRCGFPVLQLFDRGAAHCGDLACCRATSIAQN